MVSPSLLPGAFSQDLTSAAAAVVLLFLTATAGNGHRKRQLVAVCLAGYLFYTYGIYAMEPTYTGFYLLYLAIFALAFWLLLYMGPTLRRDAISGVSLRGVCAGFPRRVRPAAPDVLSAVDGDAASVDGQRAAD